MKALITGVCGQDGSYLAQQLTAAGYAVSGMVRGQSLVGRARLVELAPKVTLLEGDLTDQASLLRVVVAAEPDVVFNMAGVSAPGLAWGQPVLAGDVTGLGFVRLLEAVRFAAPAARVVQAGSLATHGPYGAAKQYSHAIGADYRKQGMHVTVAVMCGHHSPRRGREFFSKLVAVAAAEVARGERDKLRLGWLGRSQDWGWAPDFTQALALLADMDPGEYVLSTGEPHSSQEWVEACFAAVDLDWRDHVVVDDARSQPTEVALIGTAPDARLGWEPRRDFAGLADWLVDGS